MEKISGNSFAPCALVFLFKFPFVVWKLDATFFVVSFVKDVDFIDFPA